MYVPDEKMRINKFKIVDIPRPIEYMKRFGSAEVPSSSYSGDELAPLPQNKVDMLAYADKYDEMMQQVELDKSNSDNYSKDERP